MPKIRIPIVKSQPAAVLLTIAGLIASMFLLLGIVRAFSPDDGEVNFTAILVRMVALVVVAIPFLVVGLSSLDKAAFATPAPKDETVSLKKYLRTANHQELLQRESTWIVRPDRPDPYRTEGRMYLAGLLFWGAHSAVVVLEVLHNPHALFLVVVYALIVSLYVVGAYQWKFKKLNPKGLTIKFGQGEVWVESANQTYQAGLKATTATTPILEIEAEGKRMILDMDSFAELVKER